MILERIFTSMVRQPQHVRIGRGIGETNSWLSTCPWYLNYVRASRAHAMRDVGATRPLFSLTRAGKTEVRNLPSYVACLGVTSTPPHLESGKARSGAGPVHVLGPCSRECSVPQRERDKAVNLTREC